MYLGNDGVKEKRVEDDVGRRPVLFLEYYKLRRRLKALYRKKAAYIRCLHNNLANRIIRHGIDILAEKMNYKALQKRSKKTERQEKTSTVKKKDGTTLEIKKYKKKKQYPMPMSCSKNKKMPEKISKHFRVIWNFQIKTGHKKMPKESVWVPFWLRNILHWHRKKKQS